MFITCIMCIMVPYVVTAQGGILAQCTIDHLRGDVKSGASIILCILYSIYTQYINISYCPQGILHVEGGSELHTITTCI